MQPVSTHGAPKITMNSQDSDYRSKLKAAKAQADGNQFVMGVQDVFQEGAGEAVKDSRTKYGAPTVLPNDIIEGREENNFAQPGDAGNMPMANPRTQTGSVELGTSATKTPDQDPSSFQTDELERRLGLIANAASNAGGGNNDRANTGRF